MLQGLFKKFQVGPGSRSHKMLLPKFRDVARSFYKVLSWTGLRKSQNVTSEG